MTFLQPYVRKQFLVAICVYMGMRVLALCMAYPDIWLLSNPERTPLQKILTGEERLLIELTFHSGIWIGAIVFGFMSNTTGRKPCFFLSGTIFFCAFLLLATLKTIAGLYVAKFVGGLGSGIIHVTILVYLGEIASTNIRGLILTSVHIFAATQSWVNIFIHEIPFYTMSYYGLVISAVFLVTMFYIPESPVFFTLKGSDKNLEESLTSLGRENELVSMISTKLEQRSFEKTHKDNWLEIFKVRSNRNAFFIILILNILQNLSGRMSVLYFTPQLFFPNENVSVTSANIVINLCSTCGVLVSCALVEKVGRKNLLMMSTASCGLSLAILSTFLVTNLWMQSYNAWVYVTIIILANYFFSYSMGFSIISETLIGEMFTANVRSTGSAFAILTSSFLAFLMQLVVYSIIYVAETYEVIVFIIYCLTNVIAFFFTLFLVPETKGLTFSEINKILSRKRLIRCYYGARLPQEQNAS